jgi:hypothetical protein
MRFKLEKLHLDSTRRLVGAFPPQKHTTVAFPPRKHTTVEDYLLGFLRAGSCRLRPMPARGRGRNNHDASGCSEMHEYRDVKPLPTRNQVQQRVSSLISQHVAKSRCPEDYFQIAHSASLLDLTIEAPGAGGNRFGWPMAHRKQFFTN